MQIKLKSTHRFMRYRANKKVSRQRWRRLRRQQGLHQKQYVPLPFGGGHNYHYIAQVINYHYILLWKINAS